MKYLKFIVLPLLFIAFLSLQANGFWQQVKPVDTFRLNGEITTDREQYDKGDEVWVLIPYCSERRMIVDVRFFLKDHRIIAGFDRIKEVGDGCDILEVHAYNVDKGALPESHTMITLVSYDEFEDRRITVEGESTPFDLNTSVREYFSIFDPHFQDDL